MSLEDFSSLDTQEGVGNSTDKVGEVSEKFKEAVKKASSGIKRTQKDEGKAKKHDLLLANFLVKIIISKKYDILLDSLFKSMDEGFTSNFLLGILSLINIEISNKIREFSLKNFLNFMYEKTTEKIEFNDNDLGESIRDRINSWIEDIIDVVSIEYSSIITQKLLDLLENDENITIFISMVFAFFLNEINIIISQNKSYDISKFIVSEVKKSLKNLYLEEI